MFEGTHSVFNSESVPSNISYKSFKTQNLPKQNSYCDHINFDIYWNFDIFDIYCSYSLQRKPLFWPSYVPLEKYGIYPDKTSTSSPIEEIIIDAAKQLPYYFCRFFKVSVSQVNIIFLYCYPVMIQWSECSIVLSLFWKSRCSPCHPVTYCFGFFVMVYKGLIWRWFSLHFAHIYVVLLKTLRRTYNSLLP